jgi:hypothetical protein
MLLFLFYCYKRQWGVIIEFKTAATYNTHHHPPPRRPAAAVWAAAAAFRWKIF